jgi:hypothetical protein
MTKDFSADLSDAFAQLKARGNITMGDIIDIHGASALGAILTVLSIPALLPSTGIPIGGVMSLGMFAVAMSMMMGVEHVKLPQKLSSMALSDKMAEKLMNKLLGFYRFLERWSHPRWEFLVNQQSRQFLSIFVFVMAGIIFMPVPMGNTAPAFALLILGPALLLRDGFMVLISLFFGVVALVVTYFILSAGMWAVTSLIN